MQKVSHKGGNGNHSSQTPRGSGAPLCGLAVANVATLFGGIGESCFLSKKVAKWYKRLKDC
jgi:hypothetical protein